MKPALAALLLAGCAGNAPEREVLRVFAASSLTEAFQEMAGAFEDAYPEIDVMPVFAGSQVLRLQIEQGARADVFASADRRHVNALARAGLITGGRVFAENELVVIVPRDNPAAIAAFADLPRARSLVIGTEHVPAGRYARLALQQAATRHGADFEAAVLRRVVSEESNVRLARAKVELGVADAAIVYRTDAVPGRVRVIPLPDEVKVRADYLMGALAAAANPEGAELWIDFAASPAGQDIMTRRGFLAVRGQNPPGIRPAMHPGRTASLCVAPRARSAATGPSSRLAGTAPRRSRCSGGFAHGPLAGSAPAR